MILEVAILDVKEELLDEFEPTFKEAGKIISSMKGYISHELKHCVEVNNRYIFLVKWEKLEDHTVGFRESEEYQEWKALLHDFYEPFPVVEHYESVNEI